MDKDKGWEFLFGDNKKVVHFMPKMAVKDIFIPMVAATIKAQTAAMDTYILTVVDTTVVLMVVMGTNTLMEVDTFVEALTK